MSDLYEPLALGALELGNRFVRAATYEGMATDNGEVTAPILEHYRWLARGEVGLIITGHVYVHPLGRAVRHQLGIYDDSLTPGLEHLIETVHREGGKIAVQLAHAGRQTSSDLIGRRPLAPSSRGRDPRALVKPEAMDEDQIWTAIRAFGQGARRAAEAGADGIEIHAAHGYLVNQFLSPYFNVRDDSWGGSKESRFRFLREIMLEIKERVSDRIPVLVKFNIRDHTPKRGITPELAADYAEWLAELGSGAFELSRGSPIYAPFEMCRGKVPVKELLRAIPWWRRPAARAIINRWVGRHELDGPYNWEAAERIRARSGSVPLILTGGVRAASDMERILKTGTADLVGMSRPFIREPALVRWMRLGRTKEASCVSCNRCFAAIANNMPVRCYYSGRKA